MQTHPRAGSKRREAAAATHVRLCEMLKRLTKRMTHETTKKGVALHVWQRQKNGGENNDM
jgi:hypothetical protein